MIIGLQLGSLWLPRADGVRASPGHRGGLDRTLAGRVSGTLAARFPHPCVNRVHIFFWGAGG